MVPDDRNEVYHHCSYFPLRFQVSGFPFPSPSEVLKSCQRSGTGTQNYWFREGLAAKCVPLCLNRSFKERSSFGVKNPRTAHFLYTLRLLVRAILPLIERFGDSTVSYPWSSALSCPSGPSVQRQSACRARVCTTLESETGDRTLS